jgi:hypothetical protein
VYWQTKLHKPGFEHKLNLLSCSGIAGDTLWGCTVRHTMRAALNCLAGLFHLLLAMFVMGCLIIAADPVDNMISQVRESTFKG